jgi:hypothetical protein
VASSKEPSRLRYISGLDDSRMPQNSMGEHKLHRSVEIHVVIIDPWLLVAPSRSSCVNSLESSSKQSRTKRELLCSAMRSPSTGFEASTFDLALQRLGDLSNFINQTCPPFFQDAPSNPVFLIRSMQQQPSDGLVASIYMNIITRGQ